MFVTHLFDTLAREVKRFGEKLHQPDDEGRETTRGDRSLAVPPQHDPALNGADAAFDTLPIETGPAAARPLPKRVPGWSDPTPQGVARRAWIEANDIAMLQADVAGWVAAWDGLIEDRLVGHPIADLIGEELSIFLSDGAS